MHAHPILRLSIGIATICSLFIITGQLSTAYKDRTPFFEQIQKERVSADALAVVYMEYDKLASESLYRRIWTYDILIFLSGMVLLWLMKEERH